MSVNIDALLQNKRYLHALISYYDMQKDAMTSTYMERDGVRYVSVHKVEIGKPFMQQATYDILRTRREEEYYAPLPQVNYTKFFQYLTSHKYAGEEYSICRLEHPLVRQMRAEGESVRQYLLPEYVRHAFQDSGARPTDFKSDINILISIPQYIDPASRLNTGNYARNSVTFSKAELEDIGILAVEEVSGDIDARGFCRVKIIFTFDEETPLLCEFTPSFQAIGPNAKFFKGNDTKNLWFETNNNNRDVRLRDVKTAKKYLICKELGDTLQVLFQKQLRDPQICMFTADTILAARSKIEGNPVVCKNWLERTKNSFDECIFFTPPVNRATYERGLIRVIKNDLIYKNTLLINLIMDALRRGFFIAGYEETRPFRVDLLAERKSSLNILKSLNRNIISEENQETEDEARTEIVNGEPELTQADYLRLPRSKAEDFFSVILFDIHTANAEISKAEKPGSETCSEFKQRLIRDFAAIHMFKRGRNNPYLIPDRKTLFEGKPFTNDRDSIFQILFPNQNISRMSARPRPAIKRKQRGGSEDIKLSLDTHPNEIFEAVLRKNLQGPFHESYEEEELYELMNVLHYYFQYVGEICVEEGILKNLIQGYYTRDKFNGYTLENFRQEYLKAKIEWIFSQPFAGDSEENLIQKSIFAEKDIQSNKNEGQVSRPSVPLQKNEVREKSPQRFLTPLPKEDLAKPKAKSPSFTTPDRRNPVPQPRTANRSRPLAFGSEANMNDQESTFPMPRPIAKNKSNSFSSRDNRRSAFKRVLPGVGTFNSRRRGGSKKKKVRRTRKRKNKA
jgi:hypothetical protein